MIIKRLLSFSFLLLLLHPVLAQLKYANVLFEEQNYVDAIPLYERVLVKKGESLKVIENLAYCYKVINDYENAERYFSKAVTYPEASASSYLYYGQLLKSSNKINQARNQFLKFIEMNPGSLVGKLMLKSCDNIRDWSSQPVEFKIKNLEGVNSPLNEIGPFPYKDGLIYTSEYRFLEDANSGDKKKDEEEIPAYSIYFAPINKGEAGEITSFFGRNTEDDYEGPAYLNSTEDRVYFNKVFDTRRYLVNQIKIFSSELVNGVWSEPTPFYLNSNKFTITNPVLSVTGDTIFFASDMEGGYGGMDIYYCVKFNGEWGKAINLGPLINTDGIEIPSFYSGKKDLFFSSNFHPGYGGFDVFKSAWDGTTWSTPVNLKSPLNSTKDELGYVPISKDAGFFSSNRDGGKGKDDIYLFGTLDTNDQSNYTSVSGVFEYENLPIENVTLSLLDENDVLIQSAVTNNKGEFTFSGIPPGENYQIIVDEPEEKIPDGAKLYLTNSKNEKVKLLSQIRKGLFKFEALNSDEYDDLPLIEAEDDEFESLTILGEVYDKLSNQLPPDIEVVLMDDERNILGKAKTDARGNFKFTNLQFDDAFLFRLSEKDPNLEVNVVNDKNELIAATTRNEDGEFVYLTNLQKSVKNPDVEGVFKYGKLAASDVRLNLMDENDEMLQYTKTDEEGTFKFKNLNAGSDYSIKVDPSEGKVPKNAQMFLKDATTGRLLPVSKNGRGTFNFKTLAYDEPEEMALKQVIDEDAIRVDLLGEVYNKLAMDIPSGLLVYLVDDEGNIITSVTTSSGGRFKFENQVQKDEYYLRLSEKDPNLEVKMINQSGQLIGVTTRKNNGDFQFLTNLQKSVKNPDVSGVFKYGKLPASDVQLNLMSQEDELVQFTKTNSKGEFEFNKLKAGTKYSIQVDKSEGEVPKNAEMFLKDKHTGRLLPVAKMGNGTFNFETLAYDEPEEMTLKEVVDEDAIKINLLGEVYHNLSTDLPKDLMVYLLDDDGNVVANAKALSNGRFEFKDLQQSDTFLMRLSNKDPDLELKIINQQGQLIGVTTRNTNGDFVYLTNLQKSVKNPDVSGVFKYGKLPATDVQLNLINEEDEILQFTNTDAKGEFEFKKLAAGTKYRVKVDESEGEVPDNAEMYLKDKFTGILLPVAKLANGTFSFQTLAYDEPEEMTLKSTIDEDPAVKRSFLTLIDYESLPYDLTEGMELHLVDDEDRIISKTIVGKDGKFKFTTYEISKSEVEKFESSTVDKKLTIKSSTGVVIAKLRRNSLGELVASNETKEGKPSVGSTPISSAKKANTIYFDFSSYDLSREAVNTIDGLVERLKANPDLKIIVNTHTDSRGDAKYNMWLSKRRSNLILQYLILEEIEYNRIEVSYFGESKLTNKCNDSTPCTESEHSENRRAEFELVPR